MKQFSLIIIFATCLFSFAKAQNDTTEIKVYNGIELIFPGSWLEGKVKARATVPVSGLADTARLGIENAFNKYPPELTRKLIRRIYIVGTLSIYKRETPGTSSRENLYVATSSKKDVEKTIHREFSNILLQNYSQYIDKEKWREITPLEIRRTLMVGLSKTSGSMYYSSELCPKGILCDYALWGFEEDFNMYAQSIFSGGRMFWNLVEMYPLIKQKAKMTMDFYYNIDHAFTEDYFRILGSK